jgi:NO-binding membrane sensor protein with MHYT domain
MTAQQYVGVFVRLFAIWLLFLAVQTVGMALQLESHGRPYGSYAIAAVLSVVAIILWRFPMFVAHRLVPQDASEPRLPPSSAEIATVACIVLGLWLCVARAFPSFIRYVSVILVLMHEEVPVTYMDTKTWASLTESILEFAAALILVFKARSISAYLLLGRN